MGDIKDLKDLQNTRYGIKKIFDDADDFLPLNGTDYVELYVGNAKQSAHFYKTAFGFQSEAYAGLETGVTDRVSYVLKQDKIRLVLTTPLEKGGAINQHIDDHGDGVKVVALWVDDATKSWEETTKRGAKSYMNLLKKKMKMVVLLNLEFILMEKLYTYLLKEKTTMVSFYPDLKNGNLIIIQNLLV